MLPHNIEIGLWAQTTVTSPPIYCEALRWACLYVCMSVCLHVWKTTCSNFFMTFYVHVNCGRGSILFWQQRNTLYTSGFLDDVIFAHNGPYGAWLVGRILKMTHQGQHRGNVWCLRLLCSYFSSFSLHFPLRCCAVDYAMATRQPVGARQIFLIVPYLIVLLTYYRDTVCISTVGCVVQR